MVSKKTTRETVSVSTHLIADEKRQVTNLSNLSCISSPPACRLFINSGQKFGPLYRKFRRFGPLWTNLYIWPKGTLKFNYAQPLLWITLIVIEHSKLSVGISDILLFLFAVTMSSTPKKKPKEIVTIMDKGALMWRMYKLIPVSVLCRQNFCYVSACDVCTCQGRQCAGGQPSWSENLIKITRFS